MLRALIKDQSFTGKATGVDQSAVFIDAARSLAEKEGCPADRLRFAQSAAVRLSTLVVPCCFKSLAFSGPTLPTGCPVLFKVAGNDTQSLPATRAMRLLAVHENSGCFLWQGSGALPAAVSPGQKGYDAVVMHTLISHTSDPAAVVRIGARPAAAVGVISARPGVVRTRNNKKHATAQCYESISRVSSVTLVLCEWCLHTLVASGGG